MPLFRSESEEARASAWLGRIVLVRPLSFALLTAIALGMALALAAFFVFGEYTRKARVQGMLAPVKGVVRVVAQQGGVIHDLRVVEGTRVDAEGALLTIADPRASASREDLGEAIGASLDHRSRALGLQHTHALAAMESEQATLAQRRAGLGRE